jgi:3-aminobutyryl-CoA ammonia-lyase
MSVGLTVTHRRYIKYGDAHYGGGLVDGAYVLGLFGDVATEACVRMAGDEGLFASYSDVQFRAPVLAGDVIEAECVVTSVGRRSRQLSFTARVVCRADPSRGPSASIVLDEPVVAVTATGTVVVPLPPSTSTSICRIFRHIGRRGPRRLYGVTVTRVPYDRYGYDFSAAVYGSSTQPRLCR